MTFQKPKCHISQWAAKLSIVGGGQREKKNQVQINNLHKLWWILKKRRETMRDILQRQKKMRKREKELQLLIISFASLLLRKKLNLINTETLKDITTHLLQPPVSFPFSSSLSLSILMSYYYISFLFWKSVHCHR